MATGSRGDVGRKVGELAAATGLTVRTLRYYEEIGLLAASARSAGGHRLYSAADVERLYRICLLRRLGLPLAEVGRALDDPAWSIRTAMAHHLRDLDRRLEATARLRSLLAQVIGSIGADHGPTAEDLLDYEAKFAASASIQPYRASSSRPRSGPGLRPWRRCGPLWTVR